MEELAENYDARNCDTYATWLKREGLEEDGYDKKPEFKRVKKEVERMIVNSRKCA